MKIGKEWINYECIGKGENIIYLHGWGCDLNTFKDIINNNRKNYLIDLPGFGKSTINKDYTLDEYVEFIHEFVEKKNIKDFVLVGHSFGGRVAIRYARYYDVKKLILIDSAGIKLFNLKVFLKIRIYKFLKIFKIRLKTGSVDYMDANNHLKGVIRNVCKTNQLKDLSYIDCNTLIIYGQNDSVTPKKLGYIMEKRIQNSGLVIIPASTHFPYIENRKYYYLVQESFLSDIE